MAVERLIRHNPVFLSDEEIERTFIVRKVELEILADLVRGNRGKVNQHALVIGPRGMGKTLLLHRLALLVRSDPELSSAWYPILAPEEIYDAATEGEIWLAILRSLADQERRAGGEFHRWDRRYEALVGEMDEARLRTQTLAALTEFSEERGQRLLILIENLQMLLGEQFAKDADWDLRKTLLNRPGIMLVLTATTRFEKILESSFAAYELFRELELEPLGTDDCRRLWEAVSGQHLEDLRIRPMEILTGGNPRLLSILATFAPGRPLQELIEHLAELIDEHTPFLKSNIDALPPQERRVFVTLAKLWEPSTARRVGDRCRLTSNTASAVLKSLVNRGAVVEHGKVGRGKLYQVAERIYCIYYLMRLSGSEADRMRAFVRFMVPLYGEHRLARSLAEAACASGDRDRRWYVEGYRALLAEGLPKESRQHVLEATPEAFFELPEALEILAARDTRSQEPSEEAAGTTESGVEHDEEAEEAAAGFKRAWDLHDSGQYQEAIEAFEDLVRRYARAEAPGVLVLVAWALVNKGVALGNLGRQEEALSTYQESVERFADAEDPRLLEPVAKALVNKGAALGILRRQEEALSTYQESVERFADADDPSLLVHAAKALVSKGVVLGNLGRHEEALSTYQEVVERFADADDRSFLVPVAWALVSKGAALGNLGRHEEALETCEEVVEWFADADDPSLLVQEARVLVNKGVALGRLGRHEEALQTCEEVVERFADTQDLRLLEPVARALVNKGEVLEDIGNNEEALKTYQEVVERFADADDSRLLEPVARALVNKGDVLEDIGSNEEALSTYQEVVERFADADDPRLLEPVAWALVNKGAALSNIGGNEEALGTYQEVVERFADADDPRLLEPVAWALNGKAWLTYTSGVGVLSEAIETSKKAVALAPDEPDCRHTLASVYGLAGRWEEAFEEIALLVDDEHFVEDQTAEMLDLLTDAAADEQTERVLEVLSGTAAERAMEPLVVALKKLTGQEYRAPQEIDAVKEDVLARIATRRQELRDLRATIQ